MSTPAGNGSRLDAIRAATTDFLRAPSSAGLGVGIGYFGYLPLGQTSCDPARYETPAVTIGELPGRADALLGSLRAIQPIGETPTGAAIRGACRYADERTRTKPGHNLSLLMLTDGVPEAPISRENGCDPTLPDAVDAARECLESTGAGVYVLGVGPNLDNLNQIASAGGTDHAYLVESDSVSDDVLAALNAIRGTVLPCEFFIPEPPAGPQLNFDEVNVIVTDVDGQEHDIFNVEGRDACDPSQGGWYYAPAAAPERIELCEATCEFTRAQSAGGGIEYALGCGTLILR
jgi:hypothetical protein